MTELYNLEVLLRARAEGMAAFKEAESGLKGVTSAALAVGTVAVGAVAAFAVAAVVHMEEAGHAAFEMAGKFGLMPTQASAWLSAAQQMGVGNDQMSTGFKFAAKNMELVNLALANGQHPPKALQEAYKALGVEIFDHNGKLRDLNSVMLDAADAFARMPDGAEKAGLAVKLFGRSGTDLLPVLNEGRDGILQLMDVGRQSGAVMSNEQVVAAQKLYREHKLLDEAVSGLANKFAVGLMPVALQLVGWITSTAIPGLEKFFAQVAKIIPPIQQWAAQMWDQVRPSLQDIMKRSGDFIPILEAIGIVVGVLIIVLANLVVGFVRLADWILRTYDESIVPFKNSVIDLANNGLVGLATGIATVVNWFRELWNWAGNASAAVGDFLHGNSAISFALHVLGVPGFDLGGIVPGPVGAPMLAVVHGGERVIPTSGKGGGSPIYLTQNVYGSVMQERDLAFSLRETIRRLDREQR